MHDSDDAPSLLRTIIERLTGVDGLSTWPRPVARRHVRHTLHAAVALEDWAIAHRPGPATTRAVRELTNHLWLTSALLADETRDGGAGARPAWSDTLHHHLRAARCAAVEVAAPPLGGDGAAGAPAS